MRPPRRVATFVLTASVLRPRTHSRPPSLRVFTPTCSGPRSVFHWRAQTLEPASWYAWPTQLVMKTVVLGRAMTVPPVVRQTTVRRGSRASMPKLGTGEKTWRCWKATTFAPAGSASTTNFARFSGYVGSWLDPPRMRTKPNPMTRLTEPCTRTSCFIQYQLGSPPLPPRR